jgi:hypothetical protein
MNLAVTYALRVLRDAGYEVRTEVRVVPVRRWRFDIVVVEPPIGIEIQGATWAGGRHTRGIGYANDCEKLNAAMCAGWRVLWYTTHQITSDPLCVVRDVKKIAEGV